MTYIFRLEKSSWWLNLLRLTRMKYHTGKVSNKLFLAYLLSKLSNRYIHHSSKLLSKQLNTYDNYQTLILYVLYYLTCIGIACVHSQNKVHENAILLLAWLPNLNASRARDWIVTLRARSFVLYVHSSLFLTI